MHLRQPAKRLAVDGRPVPGHAEQSEGRAETEADRIRRFAADTIIEPARREGRTSISIRAGDVAASMELQHNTPNVVSALGGRKFEELARVTVAHRTGPALGANTEFTYVIGDAAPSSTGATRPVD